MVEVLISQLDEPVLDWVVAKCEGLLASDGRLTDEYCDSLSHDGDGSFTTDWAQGGPLLEREGIWVIERYEGVWDAFKQIPYEGRWKGTLVQTGRTYLAAGMRCFAVSRLGDKVDVPRWLIQRVNHSEGPDSQLAAENKPRERERSRG
jgi:hypothetical protein